VKKVVIAVIIIVLIAATCGFIWLRRTGAVTDHNVASVEAARDTFVIKITEPAEIKPKTARTISAPFTGKIAKMIKEGSHVEPGDPIVWFDTTEIEKQLLDAEAQLIVAENASEQKKANVALTFFKNEMAIESASNELERSRSQKELSRIQVDKKRVLFENELASESDVQQAKLALESATLNVKKMMMNLRKATEDYTAGKVIQQAELISAEATLTRNKQTVERYREQMDKAAIKAEAPGIVVYAKEYRGSGEYKRLQEGDQVWQNRAIAELPDFSIMTAVLYVKEVDLNRVKVDQTATVRVEAYPDMVLHGKVSNVSQVAGEQSPWQRSTEGASSFEVTVLVEGTDPRIRPGMSAIVDLIIDEVPDSVYVPQESVFEDGEDAVVYVDTGRGYEKQPVELGARNDNHVIVTAGLDGGERVCLRDPTRELGRIGVPETEG